MKIGKYVIWTGILILMVLLCSGVTQSIAQGQGPGKQAEVDIDPTSKLVTIESENLMVAINAGGQVPIYQYWSINDNETKFHVKFMEVQEFDDANDNGIFENNETVGQRTLSLQSVRWALSEAQINTEEISFNFTSANITQEQFTGFDMKIVNHIDLENTTSLKFDIYMANWPFKNENNSLSLRWDLTWTNENITRSEEDEGIYLSLANETIGYFSYVSTVQIGNETEIINTTTHYNTTSKAVQIYFSYPNFLDQELIHDPEIGVLSTTGGDGEETDTPPIESSTQIKTDGGISDESSEIDGFVYATILGTLVVVSYFYTRKYTR